MVEPGKKYVTREPVGALRDKRNRRRLW